MSLTTRAAEALSARLVFVADCAQSGTRRGGESRRPSLFPVESNMRTKCVPPPPIIEGLGDREAYAVNGDGRYGNQGSVSNWQTLSLDFVQFSEDPIHHTYM